jgi:hypothetical protein
MPEIENALKKINSREEALLHYHTNGALENLDLSGIDLSGLNFDSCSFKNSILSRVNFRNSSLKNSDLSNTDLSYVIFDNADLSEADLTEATINSVNLINTIISYTNFTNVYFYECNPLHIALADANNTYDIIDKFLGNLGDKLAIRMAQSVDKNGILPIQILNEKREARSTEDFITLLNLIISYTAWNDVSLLDTPISFNELVKGYNLSVDDITYEIFDIACKIANHARNSIKYSNTHPELNNNPHELIANISDKIVKLREGSINAWRKALIKNPEFIQKAIAALRDDETIEFTPSRVTRSTVLATYNEIFRLNKVGNCGELSMMALECFFDNDYDKKFPCEIYTIQDHEFLVLNRDKNSNPNDCSTWGNPIVCDPWSGKMFCLSEISKKLFSHMYYRNNDLGFNLLIHFNPAYHVFTRSQLCNDTLKIIDPILVANIKKTHQRLLNQNLITNGSVVSTHSIFNRSDRAVNDNGLPENDESINAKFSSRPA